MVISVLLNHRMTSHRSASGPLNPLQMATTGNWNSVSQRKQKEPLCDGHKCGRVKTWDLSPLHRPSLTALTPNHPHIDLNLPWGQPSIGCLSFWPVPWLIKGSAFLLMAKSQSEATMCTCCSCADSYLIAYKRIYWSVLSSQDTQAIEQNFMFPLHGLKFQTLSNVWIYLAHKISLHIGLYSHSFVIMPVGVNYVR